MKKYALLLVVALLAAPAFAAVQITAVDLDGAGPEGLVEISYTTTAGEKVAAFALDVSITAGDINDISGFHVGVSTAAAPGYGIFPANFDRFITVNGQGDVDDWGVAGYTPMADPNDKGENPDGITIELGALYKDDPNAPGASGVLCVVNCTESCTLSVTTNDIRGGVVLADATSVTPDLSGATDVSVQLGSGECLAPDAPGYADWVAFGRPECWCVMSQCKGDADGIMEGSPITGKKRVFIGDLNILIAAWNVLEPPKGPGIATVTNGICADFDHIMEGSPITGKKRVFIGDLNILIANWNKLEPPKGPGVPKDCPGTSIDPDL